MFGKIKSCFYILRNISENKVTQMNTSKNLLQEATNVWWCESTISVKGQGVQVLSRAEGQKIRTRIPWGATFVKSICINPTFVTVFFKNCKGTAAFRPQG